jgi:hypothetical protein
MSEIKLTFFYLGWSGTMYANLNVQIGMRVESVLPSPQLRRKNCRYEKLQLPIRGTKGCIKSPSQR